jgi:hypothetical protein
VVRQNCELDEQLLPDRFFELLIERRESVQELSQPRGDVDRRGGVFCGGGSDRLGGRFRLFLLHEPRPHAVSQSEVGEFRRVSVGGADKGGDEVSDFVRGALGRELDQRGGKTGTDRLVGRDLFLVAGEVGLERVREPGPVFRGRRLAPDLVVQEEIWLGSDLAERLQCRVGGHSVVCRSTNLASAIVHDGEDKRPSVFLALTNLLDLPLVSATLEDRNSDVALEGTGR